MKTESGKSILNNQNQKFEPIQKQRMQNDAKRKRKGKDQIQFEPLAFQSKREQSLQGQVMQISQKRR